VVQVGCDVAGSKWSAEVAELFPHVWAAVALHPNEAPRIFADGGPQALEDACGEIAALAALPQVRAVGETGMDFYRTGADGRVAQEASFRAHIDIAKRTGKALVVHDREAHADVLRILDEVGAPDRVVLHCFSGDAEFAQEAVRRGYFCSFAGVLTFKNAHDLRAALQVVPAELLLVETDGPFLTPAPYRGRTNSSYLMPLTVRAIAEQRDWALVDTCELLYSNAERAFGAL
jgi:TatD DNase family protein